MFFCNQVSLSTKAVLDVATESASPAKLRFVYHSSPCDVAIVVQRSNLASAADRSVITDSSLDQCTYLVARIHCPATVDVLLHSSIPFDRFHPDTGAAIMDDTADDAVVRLRCLFEAKAVH